MNKKTQEKVAKKQAEAKKDGEAKIKAKGTKGKPVAGGLPKLPALPSALRARKPKPMQPCACGCNTPTRSTWAPGHDARARGWAIRIERNICKMIEVPENEQAGAKLMLKVRKELPAAADKPKIKLARSNKPKEEPKPEVPAAVVNE